MPFVLNQRESQQSIKERNHQVELMGEVYSKAQTVLVWFGAEDPSTARSFRLLEKIARMKGLPFNLLGKWLRWPLTATCQCQSA